MKILTKEAYCINVTNSNSGLEEPFSKINIDVWAKNLDVEMIWNKKKLKWLLILTVNPDWSTMVSVATLASAFCCAFGWEREISCACLGCLGWSLELRGQHPVLQSGAVCPKISFKLLKANLGQCVVSKRIKVMGGYWRKQRGRLVSRLKKLVLEESKFSWDETWTNRIC